VAVTYQGAGGSTPPSLPKFRRSSKIVPNSTRLWKLLKIAEYRTPTPQIVWKKDSKILKLPPVRNCFTLAMTNKLVVIINSLKVPKIKKILLYEIKFLVRNYSCLQNPWLEGYSPPDPRLLFSTEFVQTPPKKFLGMPLFSGKFCWLFGVLRLIYYCTTYHLSRKGNKVLLWKRFIVQGPWKN